MRIVGVTGDLTDRTLSDPVRPMFFVSTRQRPGWTLPSFALRAELGLEVMAPAIRAAFREIAPDVAVLRIEPLDGLIAGSIAEPRRRAWTVALFAVSAVLLASIGLYGVLSRFVTDRRREIAIRLALGARPATVVRLVARQGAPPVLVGGAVGLAGALLAGRLMRSMLFGIGPADPLALAAAATLVTAAAAAALITPVRRALRLEPGTILSD